MGTIAHYSDGVPASLDPSPRSDRWLHTQNRMPTTSFYSPPMFKSRKPLLIRRDLAMWTPPAGDPLAHSSSLDVTPGPDVIALQPLEPPTAICSDILRTDENAIERRTLLSCRSPAHRHRMHIPITPSQNQAIPWNLRNLFVFMNEL
jgi:hypothetical protein